MPSSIFPAWNSRREPACLHDHGYASKYPDLRFTAAAVLLTRVVSHPAPGRLCLDLGHKAVAADPAGPRVALARARRRPAGAPQRRTPGHRNGPGGNHRDRNATLRDPNAHLPNGRTAPPRLRDRRRRAGRAVGSHGTGSGSGHLAMPGSCQLSVVSCEMRMPATAFAALCGRSCYMRLHAAVIRGQWQL